MPKISGQVYTFQEYKAAEFSVTSGCKADEKWEVAPDDRFIVEMVQAAPVRGQATPKDLQATELRIEIDERPVWRATADLVTVVDAGAQVQIDELRSMLLHLMNMAPPPGSNPSDEVKQAMRLAEAMRRLGWSPVTQDHRVPARSLVIGPTGRLSLHLTAKSVQNEFSLRVILRGIRQQTVPI